MNIVVANSPDDRTFFHFKNNDLGIFAVGRIFHPQLHVLEELRIPQSLKIAAQSFLVIDVVFAAEDPRLQRVIAHAPVANEIYAFDNCLFLLRLRFLRTLCLLRMAFVYNDFAGQQIQ